MKANELMIGDWVRLTLTQNPTTVTAINGNSIDTKAVHPLRYDEIEPIPMSPEILEANGWMYVDEDRMFYGEKLEGELPWITYASHGDKMVFRLRDFCHLKYVHELQHALRLCGIYKDIIIKKED